MPLITLAEYPAIRAAIDLTLDAATLPDAVIGLPIYEGAAETQVLARDPLAASRVGTDQQHIMNATILFTAALLVLALPQLTTEQFGTSYRYQRQVPDLNVLAGSLRSRAEDELDAVLSAGDLGAERPTLFSTACGRRGR